MAVEQQRTTTVTPGTPSRPPAAARRGLFATKDHDRLIAETEERGHQLRRAVGALDLTAPSLRRD